MKLKVILILLPSEKAGLIIRLIFFIKYKKTFIFFLKPVFDSEDIIIFYNVRRFTTSIIKERALLDTVYSY